MRIPNQLVTPHALAKPRPGRADIQFVDYDSVRFHISTPESKTVLLLSMAIQCWPEYGDYILPQSQTESEYDVSFAIDLERLPQSDGE